MDGDLVIVRSADGPKVVRVVDSDRHLVHVASLEQYERRQNGLSALDTVALPRDCVYQYDEALAARIAIGETETLWDVATPY